QPFRSTEQAAWERRDGLSQSRFALRAPRGSEATMEIAAEPIEQALRGDLAAREALGAWCLQYAFRLAYVDLGDVPNRAALAEEAAGEVSLKAITNLDQFRPGTRFDFWLHQILRNSLRDHFRREDRGIPAAVYQRWVHDFLATYRPELEELIQRE